jgi:RNA polymerase sigma factor FliA
MQNTQRREQILLEQLPLVRQIACQIHKNLPRHVVLEDLVQAGILGLMDALQKYDRNRHVQFASYAKFRIRGAILDSLRELDWGPRALRKTARRMEQLRSSLSSTLAREPNEAELAAEMGMQLGEFQMLRWDIDRLKTKNLSLQPFNENDDQELLACPAGPQEETPYFMRLRMEVSEQLDNLISQLPERQRQVLALYYHQDLTMKEIGTALGLGESRISQLHTLAVSGLRTRLEELNRCSHTHGESVYQYLQP